MAAEVEAEVETLRRELEAARAEAAENRDQFLRARAELDNYRKRVERDLAAMVRRGKRDLLLRFIGVMDGLDRALVFQRELPPEAKGLLEGMQVIHRQFQQALAAEGLQRIETVGKPFDPALHEAVAAWESPDAAAETVTDEIGAGYLYEGEVLRAAQVRVVRPG